MDTLKVSLSKGYNILDGISVWEWSGSAYDEGNEATRWFSEYLGKPSRLVRFNTANETRPVDSNFASGYETMFSDGYPFLLISQDSLDALNKLLKEPVPINRFRPNILVEGCDPFAEDLWAEVKISGAKFHGVKLCSRCKVPTINQENAIAGDEPIKTLREFRSDKVLQPTKKPQNKVYFGQNLVCEESRSSAKRISIQVGDLVYVARKFSCHADAAA
ncbi:unnamed protein product [Victoria cruziana]